MDISKDDSRDFLTSDERREISDKEFDENR